MKAVVIHRYGGPNVAVLEDRPTPAMGPRDVLIEARAASLNPIDAKIRQGKLKLALPMRFPIGLGSDVAGTITARGDAVTEFAVGDEVFARLEKLRAAALAEQVVADASVVARKPSTLSFIEAASIPLAGLTSLQALRDIAKLTPGQRVLIHAGAGGVGTLAIQIAKILGLHVTTTTSTRNVDFVRSLGADDVIDYTRDRVTARDLDAVFETLGGASEIEALRLVKPGGIVVGIGGLPDAAFTKAYLPAFTRPALWFLTRKRRRAAANASTRFAFLFMRPDGTQLAELATHIDAGSLRPILHATYPLSDYAAAFAELARGRSRGKIVVEIR